MVIHFEEEHGGTAQEFIMRVTSHHFSPLERQTQEAVLIKSKYDADPKADLNQKSEWGLPRVPKLMTSTPAGKPLVEQGPGSTHARSKTLDPGETDPQTGHSSRQVKGTKRTRDNEDREVVPSATSSLSLSPNLSPRPTLNLNLTNNCNFNLKR